MNRISIAVAALVVLVAACGGTTGETSDNEAAASESSQPATSTSEAAEETTTTSGGVDPGDDGELTLQDFIPGAAGFDENTDWRAMEMEVQQQVAECMAAEGFEYIPFVPSDVGGGFIGDDFDEEEYVKTYGFGVSTWVLQDQAFQEGEDPYANDPNQAIVEAMDQAEQEEYNRVLWGDYPDPLADYTEEEIAAMTDEEMNAIFEEQMVDFEPSGCYNEAQEDAYGGGGADQAFWEEFGQDFEDVYSRAESDPRIVDAQADWSACMADKGYDWANQEEMYGYFWGDENGPGEFQQRVDEVITWPGYGDYEGSGEVAAGVTTTIAEVDGEEAPPEYVGPEYDMEELQPLIDEEIAAATANYECSKSMYDIFEEVYNEYEQLFIEENLDRLTAFKEANS